MQELSQLENSLREVAPDTIQPQLHKLANLLTQLSNGKLAPEQMRITLESDPDLLSAFSAMAGREVVTSRSVIQFGQDNQLGDLTVRDIAGENIIHVTINIQNDTRPESKEARDSVWQNNNVPSLTLLARPIAMLYIVSGNLQNNCFIITEKDRKIIIGRGKGCHVILNQAIVARRHCAMTITPKSSQSNMHREYTIDIQDLDSSNGTSVNGNSIKKTVLNTGDNIQIGGFSIEFYMIIRSRISDDAI